MTAASSVHTGTTHPESPSKTASQEFRRAAAIGSLDLLKKCYDRYGSLIDLNQRSTKPKPFNALQWAVDGLNSPDAARFRECVTYIGTRPGINLTLAHIPAALLEGIRSDAARVAVARQIMQTPSRAGFTECLRFPQVCLYLLESAFRGKSVNVLIVGPGWCGETNSSPQLLETVLALPSAKITVLEPDPGTAAQIRNKRYVGQVGEKYLGVIEGFTSQDTREKLTSLTRQLENISENPPSIEVLEQVAERYAWPRDHYDVIIATVSLTYPLMALRKDSGNEAVSKLVSDVTQALRADGALIIDYTAKAFFSALPENKACQWPTHKNPVTSARKQLQSIHIIGRPA